NLTFCTEPQAGQCELTMKGDILIVKDLGIEIVAADSKQSLPSIDTAEWIDLMPDGVADRVLPKFTIAELRSRDQFTGVILTILVIEQHNVRNGRQCDPLERQCRKVRQQLVVGVVKMNPFAATSFEKPI